MTPPLSEAQRMELLTIVEEFLDRYGNVPDLADAGMVKIARYAKSQLSRQPEAALTAYWAGRLEIIAANFWTGEHTRERQEQYEAEMAAEVARIIDAQARALSARESQLTLPAAQGENIEIPEVSLSALRRVSKD